MFDMEENELNKLNRTIKNIPKPDNIDEYIRKGMALGMKKKRSSKIRRYSNIAAALMVAVFITSCRTLPTFAAYVSKIPGLEYLVNLINHDKGLKSAVENNFIQHINSSETYEGITVTIKDVILDNSKGVIFYSIENKGSHRFVDFNFMRFLDGDGKDLKAGVSWYSFSDEDLAANKALNGKVDMDFNEETVLPDKIDIEVTLKDSDTGEAGHEGDENIVNHVWKFVLPVNKEKLANTQKTYILNQSIEVEGQKVLFKQVNITPTRVSIDIEYDKNNTKKIFRFDDLKLSNEKGEVWDVITDGTNSSSKDEDHETLYFQSNYFTDSKELYLSGSSLRATDKDKSVVEVDMQNNKLLKAPSDRLELVDIYKFNSNTTLSFNLRVDDPMDEKYSYNLFQFDFKDSSNNSYKMLNSSSTSTVDGKQQSSFSIDKDLNNKGILCFTLQDYPERIRGAFKVKVK